MSLQLAGSGGTRVRPQSMLEESRAQLVTVVSANGGHGADNHRQMAVTTAVHMYPTVPSLHSHQGNLTILVNKV